MNWPSASFASEELKTSGVAFLFSGQQKLEAGMFSALMGEARFERRLALADRLCGELGLPSVRDFCVNPDALDGDEKEQIKTLALFSAQVATAEWLAGKGLQPSVVTSHSFGEYAALVVSGCLTFAEGFRAVVARETALPRAGAAGYLLAVGRSEAALKELFPQHTFRVANRNSASQTVLALTWEELVDFERELFEKRMAGIRLWVSQPFHSELLRDSATQLRGWAEDSGIEAASLRTPFVSSVVGRPVDTVSFTELISQQLVTPVNFQEQLVQLSGVKRVIEIGPESRLKPFVKEALGSQCEIQFALDLASSPSRSVPAVAPGPRLDAPGAFRSVSKAIARVTGYQVDSIRLEDRLQEDLGIDSLKATEIIVEVLQANALQRESFTGFTRAETVSDLIQALGAASQNQKKLVPRVPLFTLTTPDWRKSPPLSASVAVEFETLLFPFSGAQPSQPNLHLKCRSDLPPDLSDLALDAWSKQMTDGLETLQLWIQRFPLGSFVVSAQEEGGLFRALSGFGKSLKKEGAITFFKAVLCDQALSQETLAAECSDSFHEEVCYRSGERFVRSYRDVLPEVCSTSREPLVIVAIGGARGITREQILALLEHHPGSTVWFCGRSPADSPFVKEALSLFSRAGAKNSEYRALDATDRKAFTAFLEETPKNIDLLLVGSGVEKSSRFEQKPTADLREEWRSKVTPSLFALKSLAEQRVKRVFTTSSVIGEFGNAGQATYAFANSAIDSLAQAFGATSLAWPPWVETGMTAKSGVREVLQASGISHLPVAQAKPFLLNALEGGVLPSLLLVQDVDDSVLFRFGLWKESDLEPLFGSRSDVHSVSFTKIVSRETDLEVRDHQIGERCVFPAAVACALFAALSEKVGRGAAGLARFEVVRPMVSPHGDFTLETSVARTAEGLSLELTGGAGRMQAFRLAQSAFKALPFPSAQWTELELPLYGEGGLLFHGPAFQTLGEVSLSSDGAFSCASFLQPSGVPLGGSPYGNLAQGIDAAFQLGALVSKQKCGDLALPLSVGEIVLSDGWAKAKIQKVLLHQMECLEKHVKILALSLYSESEEVVRLSDVTLVRRLRTDSTQSD